MPATGAPVANLGSRASGKRQPQRNAVAQPEAEYIRPARLDRPHRAGRPRRCSQEVWHPRRRQAGDAAGGQPLGARRGLHPPHAGARLRERPADARVRRDAVADGGCAAAAPAARGACTAARVRACTTARSERSPAEERRAPQREGAPQLRDSDDAAAAAAHARAQRYEAEQRAEPACARRPELRERAPRPDKPTNLRASAPAGGAPGSLDEARRLLKAWSFVEEEAQRRRARALRSSPEAPPQRRRAPAAHSDRAPDVAAGTAAARAAAAGAAESAAVARWGGRRRGARRRRSGARRATRRWAGRPQRRARRRRPNHSRCASGARPRRPPPPPPRRRRPAAPPVAVPARPRMNMKDRHLRAAERRRADALVQRERAEAKRLQRAAEAERRRNEAEAAERRDNQQRLREARQQKQAALDALEHEKTGGAATPLRKRRAVDEKRRHEARSGRPSSSSGAV